MQYKFPPAFVVVCWYVVYKDVLVLWEIEGLLLAVVMQLRQNVLGLRVTYIKHNNWLATYYSMAVKINY